MCPLGWHREIYSCYYVSKSKKTWDEARDECQTLNSQLTTISSSDERKILSKIYENKERYWIGLRRDRNNIDVWKWMDGTVMTYSNWDTDEPNNEKNNEHCAETMAGPWNDQDCNTMQKFICKKV
ncbi:Hypothetical predicted protein [Pelobates cultripes]|uniref:C-type lectin domain-containing protein n=1 Tax=Pelobates cultripes TaxID=61616 RepID=A0AAD1RKV6_PELCU|nr:Hypothetical predicted protein [Pelobates cultripes]